MKSRAAELQRELKDFILSLDHNLRGQALMGIRMVNDLKLTNWDLSYREDLTEEEQETRIYAALRQHKINTEVGKQRLLTGIELEHYANSLR